MNDISLEYARSLALHAVKHAFEFCIASNITHPEAIRDAVEKAIDDVFEE